MGAVGVAVERVVTAAGSVAYGLAEDLADNNASNGTGRDWR